MVLPLLGAIAPFAPLIGGAIGALGQMFAPKPKPTTTKLNLVEMRAEAERAGFNPLAVLRSGAAMGFSTGSAPPDMRFSNALGVFGNAVSQWQYDPVGTSLTHQRADVELQLAKRMLADWGKVGAPANMSFKTPRVSGVSPNLTTKIALPFNLPSMTVANPELAEQAQTHFGEPLEWVFGVGNFIDSLAMSVTGHNPRTWKAPGSPLAGETHAQFMQRMRKQPLHIEVRGGAN